jgi:hypothetical protein
VGVGIIGLQSEGFPELADRLVGLADQAESTAEVIVGDSFIRLKQQGLLVMGDALVDLPAEDE